MTKDSAVVLASSTDLHSTPSIITSSSSSTNPGGRGEVAGNMTSSSPASSASSASDAQDTPQQDAKSKGIPIDLNSGTINMERIRIVDMSAFNVLCDELLDGRGLETPRGEQPDDRNHRLWAALLDDEYFQIALKAPQVVPHMTMHRLKLVHLLDLLESYRTEEIGPGSSDPSTSNENKIKRIECLSKALDIFTHEILEETQLNTASFIKLFVEFKSQILLIQLELGSPAPKGNRFKPFGKIQAQKFVTKAFQEVDVEGIFGMDDAHQAELRKQLNHRRESVINGINRGEISKTQEQMIEFENNMCAFLANVFNEMNKHDLPYLHPMYEIHQLQLRNVAEEMDSESDSDWERNQYVVDGDHDGANDDDRAPGDADEEKSGDDDDDEEEEEDEQEEDEQSEESSSTGDEDKAVASESSTEAVDTTTITPSETPIHAAGADAIVEQADAAVVHVHVESPLSPSKKRKESSLDPEESSVSCKRVFAGSTAALLADGKQEAAKENVFIEMTMATAE